MIAAIVSFLRWLRRQILRFLNRLRLLLCRLLGCHPKVSPLVGGSLTAKECINGKS